MNEKKTIGNRFNEMFPQTSSVTGLLPIGLTFLTVNFLKLSNISLASNVLAGFTYLGLGLICLFLIIMFIELLSKFLPFLKFLINYLILIPRFIARVYVGLIKIIIKGAVISIIDEKQNSISDNIVLRKRGVDKDDDYWDRLIRFDNIKKLILMVQPSSTTLYWRLGLKFSQNEVFTSARQGQNFPLFHLTKDENVNALKVNYYNELGESERFPNNVIISGYNSEKVTLIFEVVKGLKEKLHVSVMDEHGKFIFQKDLMLNTHKFAQLFAWGDRRDFELRVINNMLT